ncbi:MAG: TetR/AcrR family transcriptional regulator [Lysobacteraceae bacterium]|nr:MAG: TetR/AcrR family transcriptional regulator [Xanthomonadaceae bacterium]
MTRETPGGNRAGTRRGRPVDAGKQRAIFDAARRMFTEHGIAGTGMDELADAAGVSKGTIYNHFGGKRALFEAILHDLLRQLPAPDEVIGRFDDALAQPLPARLLAVAGAVRTLATSPLIHDIQRMLALPAGAADGRKPSFWRACVVPYRLEFARLLEQETRAGRLRVDDARAAASQFFSMVASEPFIRMLMGEASDRRERAGESLEATVAAFLRAWRP